MVCVKFSIFGKHVYIISFVVLCVIQTSCFVYIVILKLARDLNKGTDIHYTKTTEAHMTLGTCTSA